MKRGNSKDRKRRNAHGLSVRTRRLVGVVIFGKSRLWLAFLISTADRKGAEISVSDCGYKAHGGRLVVAQKPGL
jgi:hypothetical protein